MFGKRKLLLSTAISLALVACGGGGSGGGDSNGIPSTTSGKAVDGYLSGAVALCDTNNNGIADAGEQSVLTNDQGTFTFSTACTSGIVASGGTNIDTGLPFRGLLKAPAGSSVASPLTSLMAAGLSKDQINALVALPAGTDVTQLDPALKSSDGTPANQALLKKTLAVQQLIQQTADLLAALGLDTTAAVTQAVYGLVAKAASETVSASPSAVLIDANGLVNTNLVNTIITQSAAKIAVSDDPVLATAKTLIGSYSSNSIAELIGASVAAQAELLATSAYSKDLTKSVQSNPTAANAAAQMAEILRTGNDSSVNLKEAGQALKNMVVAQIASDAPAQTSALAVLSDQIKAQAALAGLQASFDFGSLHDHSNYFAIQNDEVAINGQYHSIHSLLDGLTITRGDLESITSVGFTLDVKGKPIPTNSNGLKTITVSVGFEMSEMLGAESRVLQVIIDKVILTMGDDGKLNATAPSDAHYYVYGKKANGVEANVTLIDEDDTYSLTAINNVVNFNPSGFIKRAEETLAGKSGVFSDFINAKGRFYFKFLMTQIDIRKCDSEASYAPFMSVQVLHSGQRPISGFGAEGIITIQ